MNYTKMESGVGGWSEFQPSADSSNTTPNTVLPAGSKQVVIVKPSSDVDSGKARPLLIVGAIQVALGLLMIIGNIFAIVYMVPGTGHVGPGIWLGVLAIVTGAIGIVAAKKLTKALVITFLVLCVICAVVTWILIGIASIGIVHAGFMRVKAEVGIAISAFLIFFGLGEICTSITAAAFSCGALSGRRTSNMVMYDAQVQFTTDGGNQQIVLVPSKSQA